MLVSAAFGGVPLLAVKKAFEGEVWLSADIQREILAVRRYLPKKLSQEQQLVWNASLFPLVSKMKKATVHHSLHLSRDPKDDMYLSLAKTVIANFLVTGDKDLLSVGREKLRSSGLDGLRIVTPKAFVEQIAR